MVIDNQLERSETSHRMTDTSRSMRQVIADRDGCGRRLIVILVMLACAGAYVVVAPKAMAQVGYREGVVTSNGHKIHYLDWGPDDKPALVLVHALGHSAHSYD